jgi:iron complex transport system substrate-binding protein
MTARSVRWSALAVFGLSAALTLTGCAGAATSDESASEGSDSTEGFPVTFDHLYGETTIESAPERVATWGWGATDAVLALGIVPVAIPADDFGGGEDRIAPWVEEALDDLGGDDPVILDNSSDTIPVEELLAADPDVLIASYSGLTEEEYDTITGAGIPIVAPAEALWATPWRDVIRDTGKALGLEDDADALLEDLDKQLSDAAAAHPEFEGTSIAYIDDDVDTMYMYLPADARVEVLEDLGFVTPESVTALDNGESTFYTTVSYESLDKIDAEVIFTQAEEQAALDEFLASDRGRLIPAVKNGAVAAAVGVEEEDAVSPTALTLPWSLPTLVEKLATATAAAKG